MISVYFLILKRFVLLTLLQGLLFNSFDLFGSYDPYIALVFILTFPTKINRVTFLIISFCFGFCLDLFTNSLGINAAACITAAFFRPYILNFVFGFFYDPHGVKILKNYVSESTLYQQTLYVLSIVFIHHFTMFFLEAFSFDFTLLILYKTFVNSILSLIFCITLISIMIYNEK